MKTQINDLNKINNTKLIESIEAYKKYHGVQEELNFIKEIEKAIFLLPIKKEKNYMIDYSKEDGTPIHFLLIEQPEGKFLPAFTSLKELQKTIKDCDIVPLTYPHLMDIVYSNHHIDGFYIGPYSLNILINKDIMEYFSQKSAIWNTLNKDTKIYFGEPWEYPNELIALIIAELKQYDIEKAYFVLMQIDENLPEFLLVLDGNYEEGELYPLIHSKINHLLDKDVVLNITSIDSHIGKQAIGPQTKPIYIK